MQHFVAKIDIRRCKIFLKLYAKMLMEANEVMTHSVYADAKLIKRNIQKNQGEGLVTAALRT